MSNPLVADPHIYLSFRNRDLSWGQVLSEFVDNSLDVVAGNATEVVIEIERRAVTIGDNGVGVKNINRLATPGSSGSYGLPGGFGQYGLGAKGSLCKCGSIAVETVYEGRLHKHEFDFRPIFDAQDRGERVDWINGYEGKGRLYKGAPYTEVTLSDFHEGKAGHIYTKTLMEVLQQNFWPAVAKGRTIRIVDRRRGGGEFVIQPMDPPDCTGEPLTYESEVNGRRYKATVGILKDGGGDHHGFFIGYGHRNLTVWKRLATRAVPSRIHGRIELSEDWYSALANFKDGIVRDKEELLEDIEKHCKELLDLAAESAEIIRLDAVKFDVQDNIREAMRQAAAGMPLDPKERKRREDDEEEEDDEKDDEKKERKPRKRQTGQADPDGTRIGSRPPWGFLVGFDAKLTRDIMDKVILDESANTLTVLLNTKCPTIERMTEQPKYPGVYMAVGAAIGNFCLQNLKTGPEIDAKFGFILSAMGKRGAPREVMIDAIRTWFAFIPEKAVPKAEAA